MFWDFKVISVSLFNCVRVDKVLLCIHLSTHMSCTNCKRKPSVSEKDCTDLFTPSRSSSLSGLTQHVTTWISCVLAYSLSQHCLQMTAVPSKLQHSILWDPVTYSKLQGGHQERLASESYILTFYRELKLPRRAEKFFSWSTVTWSTIVPLQCYIYMF